jgi:hypothetical protein
LILKEEQYKKLAGGTGKNSLFKSWQIIMNCIYI